MKRDVGEHCDHSLGTQPFTRRCSTFRYFEIAPRFFRSLPLVYLSRRLRLDLLASRDERIDYSPFVYHYYKIRSGI